MNGHLSNVEDRLREAYRAAADTIDADRIRTFPEPEAIVTPRRPGRLPARLAPGRRRDRRQTPRRARLLVPLGAAAAIVAIAAGMPALLSRVPSAAPRPSRQAAQTALPTQSPVVSPSPLWRTPLAVPPGAPRFFVNLWAFYDGLDVYRTATAKNVAMIMAPHPNDTFSGLAATSDPSRYVVAVDPGGRCGSTRLYTLRLTAGGQFAGMTPLAVPSVPENVSSLAVTPDGRYVAYAGQSCGSPNVAAISDIGLVNLARRSVRRWTGPTGEPIESLSLTASGDRIGFVIQQRGDYQPAAGILPADAPAGPLADEARFVDAQRLVIAHDKIVPTGTVPAGAVPDAAAIAADGRTLYICAEPSGTGVDRLVTYSGGRLVPRETLAGGGSCVLSLDPSGRFLLAQTGTVGVRLELIDLVTGSVTALPVRVSTVPPVAMFTW